MGYMKEFGRAGQKRTALIPTDYHYHHIPICTKFPVNVSVTSATLFDRHYIYCSDEYLFYVPFDAYIQFREHSIRMST